MEFLVPPFLLYLISIAFNISISAMEVGLGLLLLLLIIYLYKNKINIVKDCLYMIPFIIFWVSTLFSIPFGSPVSDKIGGLATIWGLLYFFPAFYFVSSSNIRLIFASLSLGGIILSLSVIIDVFIYNQWRGDGFFKYMSSGNILAICAVMALGVVCSRYEKGKFALLYVISVIIMVIGIYYTSTRGALLAFLICACAMFIVKLKVKGVILSIGLFVLAAIFASFTTIGDRFTEIFQSFTDEKTSHGWRFFLWQASFKLIEQYPLFGIGDGAYEKIIVDYIPETVFSYAHAHNGYIQLLTQYGIIGFLCFFYFYGKIALSIIKEVFNNKFAFIGCFVTLSFFVEALTEDNFNDGEIKMMYIFIAGIILGALRKGVKDNAVENKISFLKNINN